MNLVFGILDDEKTLLKFYKKQIALILERNGIDGTIACLASKPEVLLKALKKGEINTCIVDIDLKAELDGIQVAEAIRQLNCPAEVIFITAHPQYMRNAFTVKAFDYLEKPITQAELEKCIVRLHRERNSEPAENLDLIRIKSGTVLYHLDAKDIFYIHHKGFKTVIHAKDKPVDTAETLANVVRDLPRDSFRQCHRSTWVNLHHVSKVDLTTSRIFLKDGSVCELSRSFRKEFTQPL